MYLIVGKQLYFLVFVQYNFVLFSRGILLRFRDSEAKSYIFLPFNFRQIIKRIDRILTNQWWIKGVKADFTGLNAS